MKQVTFLENIAAKIIRAWDENRDIFVFALIVCSGLWAYSGSLTADFQYDDFPQIVQNSFIKHVKLDVLWKYNPSRFITNVTFALNYFCCQLHVLGWHLVNFSLHLINTFLFYRVLLLTFQLPSVRKQFLDKDRVFVAMTASLVFLLHPLQTQAVIYISQRGILLGILFYLACLYFYVMGRLKEKRIYDYAAVLSCFLAMLTDPSAVVLPVAVAVYDVFFFGFDRDLRLKGRRVYLWLLTPLVVVPFLLLGTQNTATTVFESLWPASAESFFSTKITALWLYVRWLFLPISQNLDFDYQIIRRFAEFPVLISLAGIVAAVGFLWKYALKARLLCFGVVWFFLNLIIPAVSSPWPDVVQEHWLYIPICGFAIFITILLYKLSRKRVVFLCFMAILVGILGVLTYQRSCLWGNGLMLLKDTVLKSPQKAKPHNNLGEAYLRRGAIQEAEREFQKAIELDPRCRDARNNLVEVYLKKSALDQAQKIFTELQKAYPDYAPAYIQGINLIQAYINNREISKAVKVLKESISIPWSYEDSHGKRVKLELSETDILVGYGRLTVQKNPFDSSAHVGLGNIYFWIGDVRQAKREYEAAIWLNPGSAVAEYNLGNIYFRQEQFFEALTHYNEAIRLQPNFADVYSNKGHLFFFFKDFRGAAEQYKMAVALNPSFAEGYFNLANALYEAGAVEESRRAIEAAIGLYEKQKKYEIARELRKKLSESKPHGNPIK
jgi:tetratricopeptide (TPR) repeat protein